MCSLHPSLPLGLSLHTLQSSGTAESYRSLRLLCMCDARDHPGATAYLESNTFPLQKGHREPQAHALLVVPSTHPFTARCEAGRQAGDPPKTAPAVVTCHSSFAYSALACFRMGMSGSASFQRTRKSLYAANARTRAASESAPCEFLACNAFARATPRRANAPVQQFQTTPSWSIIF